MLILTVTSCPARTQLSEPIETVGPPPGATAGELIEDGYYREAAQALESERQPYNLQAALARGELLLFAGYDREAEAEFRRVRALTPQNEAFASYGIALCALMRRDCGTASSLLKTCAAGPSYDAHREEIDLAQASLAAAQSYAPALNSSLLAQLNGNASLLAQELNTLSANRAGAVGDPLMGQLPWPLPGNVPRVEEPPGLRADMLVAQAAGLKERSYRVVAAPLAGSDTALQIVASLLPSTYPGAGAPPATRVGGWVSLSPPPGSQFSPGDIASFLIDGQVAAVVNSDSLSYRWDTTRYSNGRHSVEVQLTGSAAASNQPMWIRYYDVRNPNSASGVGLAGLDAQDSSRPETLDPADQAAVNAAWNLLELQPDYAIGENALAATATRSGNPQLVMADVTTAQAISFTGSPHFLDALSAAYAHRIPVVYANSDRTRAHPEAATVGIWRGNPHLREVALTFDDGPSPILTPPLLDALELAAAPATFFVVGKRAQLAPDLVRRMQQDGDEVEDHSYSHPNLDEATPQHVYEEILRNAVIVQALTGTWPHFLRPPGGQTNRSVLIDAARCGLTGAFWTIDALSAEDTGSPEAVVRFVLKRVKPGAVILMHNGPYATTYAIPALVAQLRSRGYKLVTLLQLARDASKH